MTFRERPSRIEEQRLAVDRAVKSNRAKQSVIIIETKGSREKAKENEKESAAIESNRRQEAILSVLRLTSTMTIHVRRDIITCKVLPCKNVPRIYKYLEAIRYQRPQP